MKIKNHVYYVEKYENKLTGIISYKLTNDMAEINLLAFSEKDKDIEIQEINFMLKNHPLKGKSVGDICDYQYLGSLNSESTSKAIEALNEADLIARDIHELKLLIILHGWLKNRGEGPFEVDKYIEPHKIVQLNNDYINA